MPNHTRLAFTSTVFEQLWQQRVWPAGWFIKIGCSGFSSIFFLVLDLSSPKVAALYWMLHVLSGLIEFRVPYIHPLWWSWLAQQVQPVLDDIHIDIPSSGFGWGVPPVLSMEMLVWGHTSLEPHCYDFSLLWTITISLLLIALTRLLLTHPIWHIYCALSQLDCRLSPYRLFLSWLLILTQSNQSSNLKPRHQSQWQTWVNLAPGMEHVEPEQALPPPAPPANPVPLITVNTTQKEVKMNTPTSFTGDRKKLEEFLIETDMYLTMNEDTYNNDNWQIIFTLSFMKDGTAGSWKQSFWTQARESNNLGTWDQFKGHWENRSPPPTKKVTQSQRWKQRWCLVRWLINTLNDSRSMWPRARSCKTDH